MSQKFFRGQRVKIADVVPPYMSHFDAGLEAIVSHSYSDMYGQGQDGEFALLLLDGERPFNRVSWYPDSLLTLVNADRDAGERLLQLYKTC
jgi:hypothetical protein